MRTMPPLCDILMDILGQHRKAWKDKRHLKTFVWMMVGLIEEVEVALPAWVPYVRSRPPDRRARYDASAVGCAILVSSPGLFGKSTCRPYWPMWAKGAFTSPWIMNDNLKVSRVILKK